MSETFASGGATGTDIDEHSRRLAINDAEVEYRVLESELLELSRARERIRHRQEEIKQRSEVLKDVIEGHKNAFAAQIVSRLPAELLSEIFLHYCGTKMVDVFWTAERKPQLILPLVCKRWKAIAYSTPRLWSSLAIDIESAVQGHAKINIPHVKQLLKRSGKAPLSLCVNIGDHRHHILQALLAESDRWHYLRLHIRVRPTTHKTLTMLNDYRGMIPLLKTLVINIPYHLPGQLSAFEDAPNLRTLVLRARTVSQVLVPWSQIRNLRCTSINGQPMFKILGKSSSLQHIALDTTARASPFPSNAQIVLPHIRSIYLRSDSTWIGQIEAPSIIELSLESRMVLDVSLSTFLTRSASSLTTLELRSCTMTPQDILTVLSDLPRLERLEMLLMHLDTAVIHGMTTSTEPGGVTILPRLQTLHLGFGIQPSGDLYAMLHSRSSLRSGAFREAPGGVVDLHNVYLGLAQGKESFDFCERLKPLQEAGMRVRFSTGDIRLGPRSFNLEDFEPELTRTSSSEDRQFRIFEPWRLPVF
ncbi:hypothetical protein HGRIS_006369 [Hohenbuehelia grisea]